MKLLRKDLTKSYDKDKTSTITQFGSKSQRLCMDSKPASTKNGRSAVDKQFSAHVCLFYLHKAFDTTDHVFSVHKLETIGLKGLFPDKSKTT